MLQAFLAATIVVAPMSLELSIPPRVRAGEPVPVTLTVTNRSSRPLTLYLKGRPVAFDVVVRKDHEVVWRRLEGATIAMILRVEALPPGGSLRFQDVWSQLTNAGVPVEPGDYTVTGALPTDRPQPLRTSPVTLHISP